MADNRDIQMDAYLSAVIGGRSPELMVVKGSMIIERRPDLTDTIDPEKMYYVTATSITEVED